MRESGGSRSILLVDDEETILFSYSTLLKAAGYTSIASFKDSREVMNFLRERGAVAVVLDLNMPHLSGETLLEEIKGEFPSLPVLVVTGFNEVERAVQCMKKGAFDYLVKPPDRDLFLASIKRAMEFTLWEEELSHLKGKLLSGSLNREECFGEIITNNPRMKALFQYVEVVAPSPQPILITGETGTGKELVAKAVHRCSGRKGEFVALNVAGLDETFFSDTLFGHRRGAFSGADYNREGLIVKAERGTLFLDEIGDLAEGCQIKLLRLLQEKTYYPLGDDLPRRADVRVVVATNRELSEQMKAGLFRSDLFYRLNAHHVHMPPLRERRDDLPLLLEHFVKQAARAMKKPPPQSSSALLRALNRCPFPGNVRELQSSVYDALARHSGGYLLPSHFSLDPSLEEQEDPREEAHFVFHRFPTLQEVQEKVIHEALDKVQGHQGRAASLLGISRQALNKRLGRKRMSLPEEE